MSPDFVHPLFVSPDPDAVADLPDGAADDAEVLASIAPGPDVAVSYLAREAVDCVVCDGAVLDADGWPFLHRLADHPRELPVVLRTADASDVPDDLYDVAAPADELGLGHVVRAASTAAGEPVADPPEQAFHGERLFFERVLDSLTDVFFVLDLDGRLVRWNDRFEAVVGERVATLRGADPVDLVADDEAAAARRYVAAAIETGQASTELTLVDGDGEPVPYEFTASLVTDASGDPRYVYVIGRDVSERRATQAELDAAIEELKRSNAELEQFAYVASHDLKEPLRMVSSYLQLLERRYGDELDGDAREFIEFAVDGATRMQEMIDDLLEYSRVGRRDGRFEPVDCDAVLETVQRNLGVAIEDANATVEVGDLPTVEGDRSRLVELFQNLVSNAIRYTADGEEPHVTVTATAEDDRWVFVVEDRGVGIPEDRIDRVFDLFYRSNVQDSTGIGLALVQKIAESHGGSVRVESTPGEGSAFYVSIPRREE